MTDEQIIGILFIVSTCVSIGYMLILCFHKQPRKGLMLGFLMLLTPVFGPCLLACSCLFSFLLSKIKTVQLDAEDLSFRKDKAEILLEDDLSRGLNKVPIEEALLEADNESMRRVLLDILKSDFETSIPILLKAISNEDTEVSHYASAAISDVLSKFKRKQKLFEQRYAEEPENEVLLRRYMDYMYRYLGYGIFSDTEFHSHMDRYEQLMQDLLEHFPEQPDAVRISEWVIFLVKQKREKAAARWLEQLHMRHSDTLELYRARLAYSYCYDRDDFLQCIREIKASTVDLDDELVEVVRFFQS